MGDNLLSWKEGVLSLFSSLPYWHYHTAQPPFRDENPACSSPCWTVRAPQRGSIVSPACILTAGSQAEFKNTGEQPLVCSCYQCPHQLSPPCRQHAHTICRAQLLFGSRAHPTGSWIDKHLYWLSSFLLTPYCSLPCTPTGVSWLGLSR